MRTTLTRTIAFWLLLLASLTSAGLGGWLVAGQVGTMTSTLLDGTATGIEVYVGQSLVVLGAALLGAGALGLLLTLALAAVQAVLPSPAPRVAALPDHAATADTTLDAGAPVDEDAPSTDGAAADPVRADEAASAHGADRQEDAAAPDAGTSAPEDDQNGSSGSIATATKISVR
ncbi:hypothetical protein [Microbacterium sp. XT11]|uniref:hypothetical protein n=1 Tax=Microbacterium sp. XT11 TaxID=367477 RepID=UPI00083766F5|nr:hypothetical protein [Microbacterium sp. XT11]